MPERADLAFSKGDPGGDYVIPVRFRDESVIQEKFGSPAYAYW